MVKAATRATPIEEEDSPVEENHVHADPEEENSPLPKDDGSKPSDAGVDDDFMPAGVGAEVVITEQEICNEEHNSACITTSFTSTHSDFGSVPDWITIVRYERDQKFTGAAPSKRFVQNEK